MSATAIHCPQLRRLSRWARSDRILKLTPDRSESVGETLWQLYFTTKHVSKLGAEGFEPPID